MLHLLRTRLRALALATRPGYRYLLRKHFGTTFPPPAPQWKAGGAVLLSSEEGRQACAEVSRLHLPPHHTPQKNWDSLIALRAILDSVPRSGKVLDAGATMHSVVLPWLFAYGYRDLTGINLDMVEPRRLGGIRYERGDITATCFGPASLDAVVCQSVIEHGVDIRAYLREMSRILKPGGLLITSTDYWETPIRTNGAMAFGSPVKIFTRAESELLVRDAQEVGLQTRQPLDYACAERAVSWPEHGLSFTFIAFVMRRSGGAAGPAEREAWK